LCPFFGFVVYWVWTGRERVGGGEVVEFPGGGAVGGEIFVEVFGHTCVKVIAVFGECGAEAVSGGVAVNFAVDAVKFVVVVVVSLAIFRGVRTSTCVANVHYFSAVSSDMVSVDCVAFVTAAGFRE
jgi:hypothetical protein